MATMQFKNINKVYINGVQAVFDFNMEVKDGEFIVLVGPSGCGKSTTLRMVAGLEEISSGDLIIDDVRINDKAPKDRDIAMVFQNYALYSHMTVYHNMAFSLILRKENSDFIHERVLWAAEVLGLTPYLNRRPAHLSGGQRQRVALGRAIVRDPKIFLLDEPLSNLDAKLRGSMRKELKALHHRLGTTMIYVTHDQIEALTLADRIVIMKDGYVQQIGTPVEVYNNPANLFVANFIGTPPMNFFDAMITKDGKIVVAGNEIDIQGHDVFNALKEKKYLGKEVIMGIRPEYIRVEKKKSGYKGFPSVCDIYELLGSDALIHFDIANIAVTAKINSREVIDPGEEITYDFDIEHIYFFDKDTEMRIYAEHK
ncbi:ABC transporter ATP-binding protein [Peloplasma aerotolerans]|uniref:Sn-glycerol-3-phosphate ABC transporter ATP-binding protein UgpC n=1 Tax=Peloplasma aerotolerans TaxID=3044389 RepID=A0AAW6U8R0_9MOLU|nr:sn-glycerol-3-phosphate ABC transporter ATP-binding protein UgpC [Mariniplasma sp. M4Ah]MDI6452493.1 sn-glycerol-3-phosphate ABC transporter ATP-binding protein UgpC [Mariniplasma sp. M4Ah]